jgi:hypothetical protein
MPTLRTEEQLRLALAAATTMPDWDDYKAGDQQSWHTVQDAWVSSWGGRNCTSERKQWWKQEKKQYAKLLVAARKEASGVVRVGVEAASEALATGTAEVLTTTEALLESAEASDAAVIRKRLRVSDKWVVGNTQSIVELRASTPVSTPDGKHAERKLTGLFATSGGQEHEREEIVRYSLPPVGGERESQGRRRDDRHRRHEQAR